MLKRLLMAMLAAGFIAVGEAAPAAAQEPAKQQNSVKRRTGPTRSATSRANRAHDEP